MRKRPFLTLLFTVGLSVAMAQSFDKTPFGVKANIQSMNVEVQFFSPKIVRVLKYPENTTLSKQSLSVIKEPEKVNFETRRSEDMVYLVSADLSVVLNLRTGKVSFADNTGNALFTEKDYGTQFTAVKDVDRDSYQVRQAFMLDKNEVIYGLGQQQEGRMNQRNQKLMLRNENMKICIPLIHSIKGYAVFWDNYSPTVFVDNPQEMSFDSEIGDCSDYYFMYGGNADGVIAQMRELSGQAPMYPLWTLGFWQSRERYKSPQELLEVVDKYRSLKVPLDGIIQDWQYWGPDSNWNSIGFDNPKFSHPKEMIDEVHRKNAHIMISVWPSFGPDTELFKIMKEKNMLLDFDTWPINGSRPFDVFNPEARDIYWKRMKQNIFDLGMDAWWLDATEPVHKNVKDENFNTMTALGSFRRVHNAYPLISNMGVYEHQREVTQAKRVFLLTRSSFFGQQRYASHSWSGDVVANWKVFRNQISAGLNYTLCGIPYWNTDIGGFFAREYGNDVKNKAYQELHVRWFQFGTFSPIMRSHNSSPVAVEIYRFGKRGDWAFDVQEKFIKLRYRLLPYLYASSWDITRHAGTMYRHLMMDFIQDKNVYCIDDQYMFGKSFLVKAITEPMYTKSTAAVKHSDVVEDFGMVKSTQIYLPQGVSWYDYWTNEKLSGGQTVTREVPIDILPLYVKAGSIIPFGPDVQYVSEKKWDDLQICVYPGADGNFVLYEDEGDNYNYEKGAYTEIPMMWNDADSTLIIGARKGSYKGMLKKRKFRVKLPGGETKNVAYTGKKIIVRM